MLVKLEVEKQELDQLQDKESKLENLERENGGQEEEAQKVLREIKAEFIIQY